MSWELINNNGNSWKSIASNKDGTKLVAITLDQYISVYSPNDPNSNNDWIETSAPYNSWYDVVCDISGDKLVAVSLNDGIWSSPDYGTTWSKSDAPLKLWYGIASDVSGQNLVSVAYGDGIWTSDDYGESWTQKKTDTIGWYDVASSLYGNYLVAVSLNNGIWTSDDYGASWTQQYWPPTVQWLSVASSGDGQRLVAGSIGGIYISSDAGITWVKKLSLPYVSFFSVASSQDGQQLIADAGGLYGIYLSDDFGTTWTQSTGNFGVGGVASSADGIRLFAAAYAIGIYEWSGGWNDPMILTLTGVPAGNTIQLPLNFNTIESKSGISKIEWGDGSIDINNYLIYKYNESHTYLAGGNYTIKIYVAANLNSKIDNFGSFKWNGSEFLTSISQWGDIGLTTLYYIGGSALTSVPPTIPSTVTDMSYLFGNSTNFNGDLSGWDVSNVTKMERMFYYTTVFNGSLSGWTLTNITDMSYMFQNNTAFNQDLSSWQIGFVGGPPILMTGMFNLAAKFNGSLSNWNVSQVTNMVSMFNGATDFNGNMDNWTLTNITDMSRMFQNATAFNQDLSSWQIGFVGGPPILMTSMFNFAAKFNGSLSDWNVSQVTNMESMFAGAFDFNASMRNWTLTNITDMSYMFSNASSFNQDLNSWIIGDGVQIINMRSMFRNTTSFNGNIGYWDVSQVTNMNSMFQSATAFNQDISFWSIGTVNMSTMFQSATAFNQDISVWDVSQVTDMTDMFLNTNYFNQNLGSWDINENINNIISYSGGLDILNLTLTLIGWAATATTKNIRDINLVNPYYSIYDSGESAINTLINGLDWVINPPFTIVPDPVLAVQYNQARTRVYTINDQIIPYTPSLFGTYSSVLFASTPTLPSGLNFNTSTGVISGTPTSREDPDDYIISVVATEGMITVTSDLSLNFAVYPFAFYPITTVDFVCNVPIIPLIPTTSPQYPRISYSIDEPLPNGLNFNTATGVITGTPTSTDNVTIYTITAISQSISIDLELTLSVSDISYSTINYVLMKDTGVGTISPTIYDIYGVTAVTFSGTLPAGVNYVSGSFSGTPTARTAASLFSLTIATNVNPIYSKTIDLTFAVADISYNYLTYDFLAGVTIGQIQPNASTYLYGSTVSLPGLPSGLTCLSNGNISGIPLNYSAQNTYTLTATTPNNYQKTINFSFNVSDISYNPLSYAFLVGVNVGNITPTLKQIFGTTTINLNLSTIDGLSFNQGTGVISGTPTSSKEQANYQLIESTANIDPGASYSKIIPFSFTVEDISFNYLTYDFLAGVNIGEVHPNGETYLNDIELSLPNLPTGLSFDEVTGIITGVPLNYSAQDTYTLTATLGTYQKSYNFLFSVSDISYATLAYVFLAGVNVDTITPLINQRFGTTVVSLNLSTIAGLSFNQGTGVISGTPTSAKSQATYPLIAATTNTDPNATYSKTLPFVLTVADISYVPLSYVYLQNQEFLYSPNTGMTIMPLTYSQNLFSSLLFTPALPSNLSIDLSNGIIEGVPTIARANPSYQLRATTTSGYFKDIPFNITVEGFNYSQSSSAFNVGDPVNLTIVQNVGAGGYSNFTISPDLPSGLSMNPITGTISGAATKYAIDNRKIYYITGYRNPTITIQLILEIIDNTIQCEYKCLPHVVVPRQVDTINTQTMRFSSLMRTGLGQTRYISNSGTNINRTYSEPARNKF